jgi:MFS family permease
VDLIGVRRVPYMARRNYVIEIRHLCLWGLFAGLVEGTVSAVVVSKTFAGSDLLIAIVQATPAFANISSLLWGALLVGRRKLPVLISLAAAGIAVALSVAVTPHSPFGGWIFALQICLSRVFMSGVVTAQAGLWRSNYPKTHRGRITAGLQVVRTLMSLPVILGCGLLFDRDESAYRWFYPAIACVGALGLLILRRIHVRGEAAAMARRAANSDGPDADAALAAPFGLLSLMSPRQVLGRMREALRQDPRFARYCTAQMCIGSANLMIMPVNTIVLTKVLDLTYTASNGLLDIIPRVAMILVLPFWARLFDRVGVLRFRVVNSACWCGSLLFCGLGAFFAMLHQHGAAVLAAAMIAYYVGRAADGLAQSGGAIAWYIGHLHFAEDDKAELYMGIHVSLTGLRGLLAPLLGTLLYTVIDCGVFAVAFVISALGMMIFARLAREERDLSPSR